jgi:hypothetical protein
MIRRAAWIAAALALSVPIVAAPLAWAGSAGSADDSLGSAGGGGSAASGSASGSGSAAGSGTAPGSGAGQVLKIPVEAGAPEVNAAAYPTVVNLGAHFTLYVTATFGAGVEVNLREPLDLGPVFEIRRRLSEDRQSADGRTTREWQIDVLPWEVGELQIAPIAVTFTAFGHAGQVETNAVPLKIAGMLGDSDTADDRSILRGLALPTGLTARDWLWIWLATAVAAGTAIAVVVLWLHRRRARRARRLVGGAIARPRWIDMTGERALERLLAIERSGVLDRDGERKAGYAEMVEVIRDYVAARYRLAIHDLTSSELLARLRQHAPPDEIELVRGWLEGCDLVKYGGLYATPAEAGKALDDARALIVATTELSGKPGPAVAREAA